MANRGERIGGIETNEVISREKHCLLHLNATWIVLRNRAKRELTRTAIGNETTWPPVRWWVAHRVHDGRQRSHAVTVCTAIALGLNAVLITTKQLRERLDVIHPLRIIAQTGYNKWVVVVPVQQFKFGVGLHISSARKLGVHDGAIDAFAAVFWVNETLKGVNHLNEFVRIILLAILGKTCGACAIDTFHVVGVHTAKVRDDILRPALIPTIRRYARQHFLHGEEGAIEDEWGALWV